LQGSNWPGRPRGFPGTGHRCIFDLERFLKNEALRRRAVRALLDTDGADLSKYQEPPAQAIAKGSEIPLNEEDERPVRGKKQDQPDARPELPAAPLPRAA
jgi:hypothetical protein